MLEKLHDDYKLLLKNDLEFFYVPFLIRLEYVESFMIRYGLNLINREEKLNDGKIKYLVANEDGDMVGKIELKDNNHLCMRIDKVDCDCLKSSDYLDIGCDYFDACISDSIDMNNVCYVCFNELGIYENDGTIREYETFSVKDHFKEACMQLLNERQSIESNEKIYVKVKELI